MNKLLIICCCLLGLSLQAQVSIMNASLNSFNITPSSVCQVTLMNSGSEVEGKLEARLYNSAGEVILQSTTNPFRIKPGLNPGNTLMFSLQSFFFGSSNQAKFIQINRSLCSGNYKYCCNLVLTGTNEISDEYCEDIESQFNEYLYLVSPADKETIEEKHPVLVWSHSEPFNLLAQGEFFRLIVVELSADQTAEAGTINNNPIYLKNYVTTHSVQYPIDAKTLEEGKRYGWQVQKISNGTIINKSESWEFTIAKKKPDTENKYTVLKKKQDGTFYTAENNKVFFRFDEHYKSGELNCRILDEKRKEIFPVVKNETSKQTESQKINIKSNGYNLFEIDLTQYDMHTGYYELEVVNEKKEKYVLKFYVKD